MTFAQYQAWLRTLKPRQLQALKTANEQAARQTLRTVRTNSRTREGGRPATYTGAFARGWVVRVEGDTVLITNLVPYAQFVEYGRKPGRFPPVDAMRRYVTGAMGVRGPEVDQVAYLVGRKVARDGVPGVYALDRSMPAFERNLAAALERESAKALK